MLFLFIVKSDLVYTITGFYSLKPTVVLDKIGAKGIAHN